jgi:N utilization substance protein B
MASRRKSRELALQMLFQWEVGKHPPANVLLTFLDPEKRDAPAESFARRLFEGTVDEASSLDVMLRAHSKNWRLERMPAIDRNVLRLALFELLHHPETPAAVVIDEALEIARRFSGEGSAEFVNGVLDAIHKTLPTAGATQEARSSDSAKKAGEPKRFRQPTKKSSK